MENSSFIVRIFLGKDVQVKLCKECRSQPATVRSTGFSGEGWVKLLKLFKSYSNAVIKYNQMISVSDIKYSNRTLGILPEMIEIKCGCVSQCILGRKWDVSVGVCTSCTWGSWACLYVFEFRARGGFGELRPVFLKLCVLLKALLWQARSGRVISWGTGSTGATSWRIGWERTRRLSISILILRKKPRRSIAIAWKIPCWSGRHRCWISRPHASSITLFGAIDLYSSSTILRIPEGLSQSDIRNLQVNLVFEV